MTGSAALLSLHDAPSHLTILVTGANGLVGRALCQALAASGHQVLAAVRHPHEQPLAGLSEAGIRLVQAPDLESADASWPLSGADVVVHTAARVHVMNPNANDTQRFVAVNRDGTERLARQCAAHGVKRLVFLSTIKVNGERTDPGVAFTAADTPNPTDPYALSKQQAEAALWAVAEQTGLEVNVIRPPLVYGPGAKGNLGVLERAVRKGWPLPIGALDFNRRSLVSLANLVDLIACCVVHPGAANRVILASDGEDVSTLGLARFMADALGVPLKTLSVPVGVLRTLARLLGRQAMLQRLTENLQVDISATRRDLDWAPVQTVAQAMQLAFGQASDKDTV